MAKERDECLVRDHEFDYSDVNDGPGEFKALSEWILNNLGPEVPLHFTAFHPDFKLQDKPRTPPETLHEARRVAKEVGLHYVYEGNIFSDAGSTYCPACGELLVKRGWQSVQRNRLRNGKCFKCGHVVPGRWGAADLGVSGGEENSKTDVRRGRDGPRSVAKIFDGFNF